MGTAAGRRIAQRQSLEQQLRWLPEQAGGWLGRDGIEQHLIETLTGWIIRLRRSPSQFRLLSRLGLGLGHKREPEVTMERESA